MLHKLDDMIEPFGVLLFESPNIIRQRIIMQKNRSFSIFILIIFCASILAACSQTSTFTQSQAATAAAATLAAMFVTATPGLSTATSTSAPTQISTSVSTALPSQPTRINFAQGATFGVVQGDLQTGMSESFVLNVAQGQPLLINLSDLNNDMYFSVSGNDGTVLIPASNQLSSWQSEVSSHQDYIIKVFAGASKENFELSAEIPSRITFAKGAISAAVSGSTVNGYAVSYVLSAAKNQTMSVTLTVPSNAAALTVYGYSDGQPYLRSTVGSSSFSMVLPSTQDYIIKVVPTGSAVVQYSMTLIIK
jgi:hypothetical protein